MIHGKHGGRAIWATWSVRERKRETKQRNKTETQNGSTNTSQSTQKLAPPKRMSGAVHAHETRTPVYASVLSSARAKSGGSLACESPPIVVSACVCLASSGWIAYRRRLG